MAYMCRHSSVGTILQLIFTKRVSFNREKPGDPESLSDDGDIAIPPTINKIQLLTESSNNGGSTEQKLVQWSGDGGFLQAMRLSDMDRVLMLSQQMIPTIHRIGRLVRRYGSQP